MLPPAIAIRPHRRLGKIRQAVSSESHFCRDATRPPFLQKLLRLPQIVQDQRSGACVRREAKRLMRYHILVNSESLPLSYSQLLSCHMDRASYHRHMIAQHSFHHPSA